MHQPSGSVHVYIYSLTVMATSIPSYQTNHLSDIHRELHDAAAKNDNYHLFFADSLPPPPPPNHVSRETLP